MARKKKLSLSKTQKNFIQACLVALFFIATTGIYLHNLTRDIYSGDIGDLVTASCVHGVAHPPGYPLFTLLGGILCELPLPLPPVSKVGLISAFSSLIGLFFYFKLAERITKSLFIALLSTSILAFSYLFWLHAEIPEVFALNNFFAIIIFYFAILFYQEKKIKYFYLLAFFTGLSLTHHHTIIFIFPGILVLILKHIKVIFSEKKRILYAFFLFLLGFSVYLYVPIAASRNPPINWNTASNFNNFIHLLLRKDYGGFTPSITVIPLAIKLIVVKDYFRTLLSVYSYQVIFIFFLGSLTLFRSDKRFLFSLLLAFFLSGPFFVFYGANLYTTTTAIGLIERFYTLSSVIFMFFIPYGFLLLKDFLIPRFSTKAYSTLIIAYFLIIPYFLITVNYQRTNLSYTRIGNNFASDILSLLPSHAVLFVYGDTTTFNIWYIHYVLGQRKDISVINPGGLSNMYLDEEINRYKEKHPDIKLHDIVRNTIADLQKRRQIFATFDMANVPLPKDTILIPRGLVYELVDKKNIQQETVYLEEVEISWKKNHIKRRETLDISEQNPVAPEIPMFYSNGLVRVGDFLLSHYNNPAKAEHYYRRALWIDPENPSAYSGLALAQYKGFHDCKQSLENMKQAIEYYPIWKTYYAQLYILYNKCNAKKDVVDLFKKNYYAIFRRTIDEDLPKHVQLDK